MNISTRFLYVVLVVGYFLVGCDSNGVASDQSTPAPVEDTTTSSSEDTLQEIDLQLSGVDVSHFQGEVDWVSVAAAGKRFAFCKATEGSTVSDPQFEKNWAGIKQAGMVRGAYHFYDPAADAKKQAEHFISVVTLEPGDLAPVLDIEVQEGQNPAELDAEIQVWLNIIEDHYAIKPIIYSDYSFLQRDLAMGFCNYPLWLAAYEEKPPVGVACWDRWSIWQYSESGQVSGISGNVDLDKYAGTEIDWKSLLVQ